MKNVSKRTKIVLAIVGVLVVAVIVGGILGATGQVSRSNLFGLELLPPTNTPTPAPTATPTPTPLVITPSNPTINVGAQLQLTVNSTAPCDWTSGNPAVVSFVNYTGPTKSVTIIGNKAAQSYVEAKCWKGVTTNVTVK